MPDGGALTASLRSAGQSGGWRRFQLRVPSGQAHPNLLHPSLIPMPQARSAWDALLLAAYMNLRAGLYFELLSCYMGKGDKETFAAALAAVGAAYAVIPTPVGSAGVMHTYCRRGPAPWPHKRRMQPAVCCQASA